jgi:hypothetical protein
MTENSDWRSQQDHMKSGDNNGLAEGVGEDRPIVAVKEISTAPAPSAVSVRIEVVESVAHSASHHVAALLRDLAGAPPVSAFDHARLSAARSELQKAIDDLGFMAVAGALFVRGEAAAALPEPSHD